jgi:hypothetical protein
MPRKGANLSAEAKEKNAEAIKRWHRENTEGLTIRLRKGKREEYNRLAAARGISLSALIQSLLDEARS